MEIPLSDAVEGKRYTIIKIVGGRGFQYKLSSLGINKGAIIKVIYNKRGPIVININDSQVAVSQGIARRILVKEVIEAA